MRTADVEAWLEASQVRTVVVPLMAREPMSSPPAPADGRLRVPRSMRR
jgi:hypothetical protein